MSTTKKSKLASYQLKDVAQKYYNQWPDSTVLGGCPLTWEICKKVFIDIFFPRYQWEDKVHKFINLHQGGMSDK